jgi:hypothetical protein
LQTPVFVQQFIHIHRRLRHAAFQVPQAAFQIKNRLLRRFYIRLDGQAFVFQCRFLFQKAHRCGLSQCYRAAVASRKPGDNPQDSRLSRPVPADQRGFFAGQQLEGQPLQYFFIPEIHMDIV